MPIPVVESVNPPTGDIAGGTLVTLTGQHFTGAWAVTFGAMAAVLFRVDSDTQISAVAPAFDLPDPPATSLGPMDVRVTNVDGQSNQNLPADGWTAIVPSSDHPPSTDEIAWLRVLVGDRIAPDKPEEDAFYTDQELLDFIVRNADNLYLAAGQAWRGKAAEFANLIDVSESGSERRHSQLFRQAMQMAVAYETAGNEAWQYKIDRPKAMTANILDPNVGGPNDLIFGFDPVVNPQFDPWLSGTARFWPIISILS